VFGDWIFFGLTVAALFLFRRRFPPASREPGAFLTPGYPWVPGLFVAAALLVIASAIRTSPARALFGTLLLATGVPVYFWFARRSGLASGRARALPTWSGPARGRGRRGISRAATSRHAISRISRERGTLSTSRARVPTDILRSSRPSPRLSRRRPTAWPRPMA